MTNYGYANGWTLIPEKVKNCIHVKSEEKISRCIIKIKQLISEDKENLIIVEGIRSPFEVELFKEDFPDFTLLSVFASPETRFQRITSRGRGDDTQDINAFRLRDKRELDFGIGNVIATSDYIIVNETTFNEYNKKIDEFFDKILNHETIYLQ